MGRYSQARGKAGPRGRQAGISKARAGSVALPAPAVCPPKPGASSRAIEGARPLRVGTDGPKLAAQCLAASSRNLHSASGGFFFLTRLTAPCLLQYSTTTSPLGQLPVAHEPLRFCGKTDSDIRARSTFFARMFRIWTMIRFILIVKRPLMKPRMFVHSSFLPFETGASRSSRSSPQAVKSTNSIAPAQS